jgi:hypothetical protein
VAIKDAANHWEALAFSNKPDPTDNTAQVLLINQNGIGFSSTGLYGTYYSAWTLDGHLTLGGKNNEYGTLTLMGPDPNNPNNMIQIGKWDKDGISVTKGVISGTTIQYGKNNLLTELKYGPSAAFGGSEALLISGNDRMAIESSAYQVRVTGASFHGGTTNGAAYLDINSSYATLLAPTGIAFTSPGYISLRSGNDTARVDLQNGEVYISHGKLRLDGDITKNSTSVIFRYAYDADDAVSLNVGNASNALEHLSTGNFVKWTTSSDRRVKKGIKNLKNNVVRKFFDMIRPVSFMFKKDKEQRTHFGLIAQELEEVLNDLGLKTDLIGETSNKIKYIDYPGLIGLCLEAIKDLYERVETLEKGSTK